MEVSWIHLWPLLLGIALASVMFARFSGTNPLHKIMNRFLILSAVLGGAGAWWHKSEVGVTVALATLTTTAVLQLTNLLPRPGEYASARIAVVALLVFTSGLAVQIF